MNDLLRVTVLGSCRVYDPFKLLADEGKVEIDNAGVYGYVHYAKEAVQQMRVMQGELAIPLSLKPYITHRTMKPGTREDVRMRLNDLRDTDLLVVEVSSLKEIEFRGYYLQINRLREKLIDADRRLEQWWNILYKRARGSDDEPFERSGFVRRGMSDLERELIAETRVAVQQPESLRQDMRAIGGRFEGPILWVSHFDTTTLQGAEIPIRKDLVAALQNAARDLAQPFYNPRELIEAFGLDRALIDMAHFTPDFERALADDLFKQISALSLL